MSDSDRDDPPPPQSESGSENDAAPPPPQDDDDDDEEPPKDDEEDNSKKGGYEVSHSPLRVSDARKKFQFGGEEEEAKPKSGPAKPAGAPKAQNGKYKYADLKQPGSKLTKDQIDVTCREDYLSREEFEQILECTPDEFKKMPAWKKDQKKKFVGLF